VSEFPGDVGELLGYQLHRADELRDRGLDPTKIPFEQHGQVLNGVVKPPADAWLVTPPVATELEIATLEDFTAIEEDGAEPLVGGDGGALIPEGGDVMFYGDGGAGKTTLAIDLAFHLAAGEAWLGIAVSRQARVLLVENEGPRPLYRQKLRRKREAWAGGAVDERISVLEAPWARMSFDDEACREALAEAIRRGEVDVVIVGPVARSGMHDAGTLQEVRDFMALVDNVRERSARRVAFVLVHHENKGGKVSGAWEGAGDTLFHVQGQGHGRTRLYVQKARWSSESHATSLNLLWTDGEGFAVEERPELDDEALAELIVAGVRENPGTGWMKVRDTIKGVGNDRIDAIRDGLFASGRLVNVVDGEARYGVEPRRAAPLHLPDDPTISHLCQDSGAAPAQTALALAAEGTATSAPCAAPIRRRRGAGAVADTPPLDEERVQ
jgi:putative DNA primase/helicase